MRRARRCDRAKQPDRGATEDDVERIAGLGWETFPQEVDELPPYALLIAVLCFMPAITGVVLLVATLRLRRKRERSIHPSH